MRKNKTIMRLLSKILFAGLLTSILPTSLPLNSQPRPGETIQQAAQRKRLKRKVEQKIKQIRSINWRLKAVQVSIPSMIIGGGLAAGTAALLLMIVIAIGFIMFIKSPLGKKELILMLKEKKGESLQLVSVESIEKFAEKEAEKAQGVLPFLVGGAAVPTTPIISVIVGAIVSVLLGATGLATVIAKKIFGLSTTSVTQAFSNAQDIKELAQANLITLTPEQKAVIAKLKKRQQSLIIQGIIKNLRLKDIQKQVVNASVQAHSLIVAKPGDTQKKRERRARKLFANYIKMRWKEKNLQKQAAELAAIKKEPQLAAEFATVEKILNLKDFTTKQLNKIQTKIKKLETQYPALRAALKKSVNAYSDKADEIHEKLKNNVTKALKKIRTKLKTKSLPAPQKTVLF